MKKGLPEAQNRAKDIDIKRAISFLNKGKQAVMSQTKLQYTGNKINKNKSDNSFYPLTLNKNDLYVPNGAVFAATKAWLLKNDTFFAFSEHGLGPKGNPIFPLPWADNKEMSFLIEPSLTLQLLTKIGFKKISFLETGKKYMEGYEKSLKTKT